MSTMPMSGGYADYDLENQQIERRRKMAEMLAAQQGNSLPAGQMVGNQYVPTSWTQHLSQALKGPLAERELAQLDKRQADVMGRKQADMTAETQRFAQLLGGTPAQTFNPATPNDDEGNPIPSATSAAVPGNRKAALAFALTAKNPMLAQIGAQGMMQETKPLVVGRSLLDQSGNLLGVDQTWQAEQQAAREAKQAELQARMEDARVARTERETARRELAQMQIDARREMAQLAGSLRQAPAPHPVTVIDDKGNQIVKDARTGQVYGRAPGDVKLEGAFNQDTAALNGGINSFDRLATAANEALNHPGLKGITGLRGAIPNIPGTNAADAQAKLNTLKSQVGFGVLQDMRNNSKTGGALGSVSDAEGKRLEANLAALENAQSLEQMQDSLKKIVEYSEGAKGRLRQAYNMKHGNRTQQEPAAGGWVIKPVP